MKSEFENVQIYTSRMNSSIDFDIDILKDRANHSIWIAGAALTFLGIILAKKFDFFTENCLTLNIQTGIGILLIFIIGCAISIVLCTNNIIATQRFIKTCFIKQEIAFLQKDSLEGTDFTDIKDSKLYFKLLFKNLGNLNYLDSNEKKLYNKSKDELEKKGKLIKYLFVGQISLFMLAIISLFICGMYVFTK